MSLERKVQEVLRQYYYEHHDKVKMQADLVGLIESEKHDFLTKLIGHVDTRLRSLHDSSPNRINDSATVKELEGMCYYLRKQRGDKDLVPPPSVL